MALCVLYPVLAFGARIVLQLWRTGSSGFKGISGGPGSAEWTGGMVFVLALGLGFVAPVLDLLGLMEPAAFLGALPFRILGFALFGLGLVGTLVAQVAMGDSWRKGLTNRRGRISSPPGRSPSCATPYSPR